MKQLAAEHGDRDVIVGWLLVDIVKVRVIVRFEGHQTVKENVEADAGRPDINWEPMVAILVPYLWRVVAWRAAPLVKPLVLAGQLHAAPKVANLDAAIRTE